MLAPTRRILILIASLSACGGDDDDGGDDNATTLPGDDGATAMPMTGDDDGATAMTGDDDGADTSGSGAADDGMAGPPVINSITWTHAEGCMMNTGSDVTVVFDVTDPDNDVSELTFSGMAIGCTGMFDAPEVTLVCPQASPYTGTVTVEDPDGNMDMMQFTIEVCVDGSA